ncbi:MBL fold metallo-hydrolase [Virgibacillus kimchii]
MRDTISRITIPTPFAVGDTHMYLLKGDRLSLIDAGVKTEQAWEACKQQLKEHGYGPNDIEQIILTHHHPDHIGLIEQFPRAESMIAHKNVDLWLTRDESFFHRYIQFFKYVFVAGGIPEYLHGFLDHIRSPLQFSGKGKLTSVIEEGDILPGHEEWQVIETKGHAQSHLSFFRESDGAFIAGDHLLYHISPNPLMEPSIDPKEERPKPMLGYRNNLKKCLSLGINTVFPGHGKTFNKVEEIITKRLKSQEKRAEQVFLMLKDKPQTPFQLCRQIFPSQFEKQIDLTMSETIGQLDYLENEGRVGKTMEGNLVYYYIK